MLGASAIRATAPATSPPPVPCALAACCSPSSSASSCPAATCRRRCPAATPRGGACASPCGRAPRRAGCPNGSTGCHSCRSTGYHRERSTAATCRSLPPPADERPGSRCRGRRSCRRPARCACRPRPAPCVCSSEGAATSCGGTPGSRRRRASCCRFAPSTDLATGGPTPFPRTRSIPAPSPRRRLRTSRARLCRCPRPDRPAASSRESSSSSMKRTGKARKGLAAA
mmetsp:Transcript_28393/g.81623  ORF Transcript_28393/g.81623 Transcript_28393/m.81623 type:complete len:227 (+) Transcript_28393:2188-2868(+)